MIMNAYTNDLTVQAQLQLKAQHQFQASISASWSWWDDLLLHNGLIYVPEDEVVHIILLQTHHDAPLIDHFSIEKTTELLFKNYYFPNM
jgi:hypothetical protein